MLSVTAGIRQTQKRCKRCGRPCSGPGRSCFLDSSYFVPWLFPCKIRTFAPVRYTERPIVAAAKLREGKFVILVNGSPSALILPTLSAKTLNAWMTMQERPILHPSAGAEIYLVLPEHFPAGRVRLLGGLPARTPAAPTTVQNRGRRAGYAAAAVWGNASGDPDAGDHSGGWPADAPDPGALCQPDRCPHHRGCRHSLPD